MKYLAEAIVIVLMLSSCNMIHGSGRMTTENRTTGNFTEIEAAGSINVEVKQGDKTEVIVEADDNILEHVETKVEDDRLTISLEEGGYTNINVTVTVTLPQVKKLLVNGSGSITCTGTISSTEEIILEDRGSGSLSANLHAPSIIASVHGSGSIKAKGQTKSLKVKNTGSGSVNCAELLSENTNADTDGSGSSHVFASVSLKGELDGSGDIIYSGDPASVNIEDNGSGTVSKK